MILYCVKKLLHVCVFDVSVVFLAIDGVQQTIYWVVCSHLCFLQFLFHSVPEAIAIVGHIVWIFIGYSFTLIASWDWFEEGSSRVTGFSLCFAFTDR